jgi:16S rRNA (uracil1498-N3)-methyltransferase
MPPRFFAPALTTSTPAVTLPPGESQHLARVLRLTRDAPVEIFDGRGALHAGRVLEPSVHAAVIAVDAPLVAAPEPPAAIVLVQALLKGDAMDAVIRDATVLGASEIRPVVSARTNVPARAATAAGERWLRVAVAAAKQCGRAVLPAIASVTSLDAVVRRDGAASRLWLSEPAVGAPSAGDVPPPAAPLWLAVGPEGGWTAQEVRDAVEAGWRPWTVAPVTLRAEHVTLAALAVVRHAWAARRIT